MIRVLSFLLLLSVFVTASAHAADCAYHGDAAAGELKRGVNLSRWWEDDRHQALDAHDIKTLRDTGIDFVRLPVSPKWLMLADTDEQNEKLAQLRCDIISLLNQNLSVVIDIHAPGPFQRDLKQDTDHAAERLADLWKKLQPIIGDLPARRIFLGLYNEPHMDADSWWHVQGELVDRLRDVYHDYTFIVTASPDGGPWDLEKQKPYDDKNILYDFHFYQPLFFTHHGADWRPSFDPRERADRPPYPVPAYAHADDDNKPLQQYLEQGWNRAKLAATIGKIVVWRDQHHVHIACLEFGVYRPYVDTQSRLNWLYDVRELFEQNGIPWALWEYKSGFYLFDNQGKLDETMANALGLGHSPAQ